MNQTAAAATRRAPTLRVGDLVEVRSAEEILATLDEKGELECMPFMPEMLEFCGRRMTVHKTAHKLCEIVTGAGELRWLNEAVHLTGARCTGAAHGGCQTACTLYWKEAWLRRVEPGEETDTPPSAHSYVPPAGVRLLEKATMKEPGPDGSARFSCQATELLRAAPSRLRFLDLDQYVVDVKSGNVGWFELLRSIAFHLFNAYQRRSKRYFPRWLLIKGGLSWGFVEGKAVGRTPTETLDLKVGEMVRIKSRDEIVRTLDKNRLNRGMGFEEEMARSCGKITRVLRRVDRCIDEKTGKMMQMKNPCIILEGVFCKGVYHANCPREYISFWREIWLERVTDGRTQLGDQRESPG